MAVEPKEFISVKIYEKGLSCKLQNLFYQQTLESQHKISKCDYNEK